MRWCGLLILTTQLQVPSVVGLVRVRLWKREVTSEADIKHRIPIIERTVISVSFDELLITDTEGKLHPLDSVDRDHITANNTMCT